MSRPNKKWGAFGILWRVRLYGPCGGMKTWTQEDEGKSANGLKEEGMCLSTEGASDLAPTEQPWTAAKPQTNGSGKEDRCKEQGAERKNGNWAWQAKCGRCRIATSEEVPEESADGRILPISAF